MPDSKKITWIYLIVAGCCIAGYFISKSFVSHTIVEKKFAYQSLDASEAYMVWGSLGEKQPDSSFWPSGSYFSKEMIWTKMSRVENKFVTSIKLPAGWSIYYWLVRTKDSTGGGDQIWDSGGDNQTYYTNTFLYPGFINPGYFIFLAGFIPLLIFFLRNRVNRITVINRPGLKIKEYIPQFDSIRSIAVFLVIIHHWIPAKSWVHLFPNGALGVNIFFVLSGFLITKILLKANEKVEGQQVTKGKTFQNFYARRSLRIFPIYYLLLIIFWAVGDPEIRSKGIYYFTYTSNLLFYSQQYFPGRLAHLWSLAVEEQFYLLWPCLIILSNKRMLPYIIGLFLIIGISTNYMITDKLWWPSLLTPTCFDAFAIGGFLAYMAMYRHDLIHFAGTYFLWFGLTVLVLFILNVAGYSIFPTRTIHSLLAAVLIYYCLYKRNNRLANLVLNNKTLIQMGKISYGIYLYHLVVPELWEKIIEKFAGWNIDLFYNKSIPAGLRPVWVFIQEFSFLILICIISWKLIEKPINSLKNNFK